MSDAAAWGIPAELVEQEESDTDFPVWPENMPIVDAFLAVQTQWRAFPLGAGGLHWQGLDYVGVAMGLDREDIRLTPPQWTCLRIMERAAISALNGVRG